MTSRTIGIAQKHVHIPPVIRRIDLEKAPEEQIPGRKVREPQRSSLLPLVELPRGEMLPHGRRPDPERQVVGGIQLDPSGDPSDRAEILVVEIVVIRDPAVHVDPIEPLSSHTSATPQAPSAIAPSLPSHQIGAVTAPHIRTILPVHPGFLEPTPLDAIVVGPFRYIHPLTHTCLLDPIPADARGEARPYSAAPLANVLVVRGVSRLIHVELRVKSPEPTPHSPPIRSAAAVEIVFPVRGAHT